MIGRWLVVAQTIAMLGLVFPGREARWPVAGAIIIVFGGAWMLWTLSANRPGNFNIRPEPKAGARLVTAGPYGLVRHPMYFGGLVAATGCVLVWPDGIRLAAWLALFAVVILKARREERGLMAQFPGYAHYRRGRRFLVPWIW